MVRRAAKGRFGKPAGTSPGAALPPPILHPASATRGYLLLRRPIAAPVPVSPLPQGVTLSPITATDAAAVHRLLQAAYTNGFGNVPENLLDWWEGLVTDSEFDRKLAVVARQEGEVVGFCLCWTSSFVKDLVVDPGHRNHGIASALLANAIEALGRRGAEEIALKVDIYNATAQRLYRRFGFGQE